MVRLSSWEGGNIVQFSEREQHLVGHVTTNVFFQSSLTMAPLLRRRKGSRKGCEHLRPSLSSVVYYLGLERFGSMVKTFLI